MKVARRDTNARRPNADAQFAAFLSRFSPETVALAKRCLTRLRRAFPGCDQLVYNYSNSVVISFTMTERGYEGIVAMAVLPRDVRLYFDKSVPDPKGLLEGAGSKVRSVTVASATALDRGDIKSLIQAAKKHSGLTFTRARSGRVVIKSKSKKPVAKKARRV